MKQAKRCRRKRNNENKSNIHRKDEAEKNMALALKKKEEKKICRQESSDGRENAWKRNCRIVVATIDDAIETPWTLR